MKKLLAVGLVLMMCLGAFYAMAEEEVYSYSEEVQAADGSDGFRIFQYTLLEDGSAEIHKYDRKIIKTLGDGTQTTRTYRGESEQVVIPDTLDGYPVTVIGQFAFAYCESISSVIIPDGVTTICESAFSECTNLISVVIPDSVTAIDSVAFYLCSNLTSVVIPDSVTHIGNYVFGKCNSVILTVGRGSYAEQYCIDNDLNYQYAE